MVSGADRPVPRAHGIDPGERLEVLRELLTVERERLSNALKLERERGIVFPETTVIVKDIERLVAMLASYPGKEDIEIAAPTDLLAELLRQSQQ